MTRPDSPAFHAPHRLLCRGRGWQVVFSCGLCGKEYAVLVPQAGQPEQALALAAAEAKLHFNWCRHCGIWVCDEHFNEKSRPVHPVRAPHLRRLRRWGPRRRPILYRLRCRPV